MAVCLGSGRGSAGAAPAGGVGLEHGDFQPAIVTGGLHLQPFSLAPWGVRDPGAGKKSVCLWYHLPAPAQLAVVLGGGAAVEQRVSIPKEIPGNKEFGGLFAVSILGALPGAQGPAVLRLSALDPVTGEVLAEHTAETRLGPPPVVPHAHWRVTADSVLSAHHAPFNAVDENPDTLWYTQFGKDAPGHPHTLVIDMGRERTVRGVLYQPRRTGVLGIVAEYAVYLSPDGRHWGLPAAEGKFEYHGAPNRRQIVIFPRPVRTRYVKFETRSEIAGRKRASAAEIRPLLADAKERAKGAGGAAPVEQVFLPLAREVLRKYAGKTVVLRITGVSRKGVVVDDAAWRLYPLGRHFNLGNWGTYGSKGIYEVDAGPLGIEAISYPGSTYLPIMNVRDGSPAARAGLRIGDIIIAVAGKRLPGAVNRAAPAWTTASHAAVIGRAILAAQEKGEDGVDFRVVRGGRIRDCHVLLPLRARKPFGPTFPFHDPQADAMRRDILDYLVRTQEAKGCWHNGGNDYMQTALAGLALLGTGDSRYAANIKRAADYCLQRYKYPSDLVYLDYWCLSYIGWFLCEYHLATGDPRVIPWLERMLDWLPRTTYMSWWDYPVWGHGSGGLPYGGKSLISPTVHLYLFGSLARICGVPGRNWDITRIHLFRSWSDPARGGHGGIGYGPQLKDVGQAWSRTGLTGLALKLRHERPDMVAAITRFMDAHDYLMFNSHGYGTAGMALGLAALSQLDPKKFREIMPRWRWLFTLAWEPGFGLRYSSDHMGYAIRGDGYMTHFCGFLLGVIDGRLRWFGGRKTRWLDVSAIPTPPSPVEIKRSKDGVVTLECRLAGPEIRYTLDGRLPTASSPVYRKPFPLPEGGIVAARAFCPNGDTGPAAWAAFGRSHASWIAESSNKSRIDPQQRWAQLAIDGDPQTWWQTDKSGRAIPPHFLIIRFGQTIPIAGITVLPRQDAARGTDIKDYAVFACAGAAEDWGKPVVHGTLPRGKKLKRILFPRVVRASRIKLEIYSTHGNWCYVCAAEVGVIQPRPTASLDPHTGTRLVLTAPGPGYTIRYTLDGSMPGPKAPRYTGPVSLAPEAVAVARCETPEGWRGPPILFRAPPVRFYAIRFTAYPGKAWGKLPDFAKLTPRKQGTANEISLDVVEGKGPRALVFEGRLRAVRPGEYRFYTKSDDGTRLFIDGRCVVDNDGEHGAVRKTGRCRLDSEPHRFRLEYFDAGGASCLEVGAEKL